MTRKLISGLLLIGILGTIDQPLANGQGAWTEQGTASGVNYEVSHLVYVDKKNDPPVMANTFNPGDTVISNQTVEVQNTTNATRKVELEVRLHVWDTITNDWQQFGTFSESRTLNPNETATIDHEYDYIAPGMPNTPERIKYTVRLVIQNNFVVRNVKQLGRHH